MNDHNATAGRVVVVSIGTPWRRDDGVGFAVLEKLRRALPSLPFEIGTIRALRDPLDLLGVWDEARLAVVIDASRSFADPGSVFVVDPDPTRDRLGHASTHDFGITTTLRLARAMGRPPLLLKVVAVEGEEFGYGMGLSEAVASAVDEAAEVVTSLIQDELSIEDGRATEPRREATLRGGRPRCA